MTAIPRFGEGGQAHLTCPPAGCTPQATILRSVPSAGLLLVRVNNGSSLYVTTNAVCATDAQSGGGVICGLQSLNDFGMFHPRTGAWQRVWDTSAGVSIVVEEDPTEANIHGECCIWAAGVCFARLIESAVFRTAMPALSVIELVSIVEVLLIALSRDDRKQGAGTGLVSLVAAHQGAHVLATDQPCGMPVLNRNIDRARGAVNTLPVSTAVLEWTWPVERALHTVDQFLASSHSSKPPLVHSAGDAGPALGDSGAYLSAVLRHHQCMVVGTDLAYNAINFIPLLTVLSSLIYCSPLHLLKSSPPTLYASKYARTLSAATRDLLHQARHCSLGPPCRAPDAERTFAIIAHDDDSIPTGM